MSDSIKIFRFISSEEVLAKVVKSDDTTISIEQGVSLVPKSAGDGQISLGFAPFMPYTEGPVDLNASLIAAVVTPSSQLIQEYNRLFSPIIQPPILTAVPKGPAGPSLIKP